MKKKKSLIALATIFVVAVGVTFAYFNSSAVFENQFNLGNYNIVTQEVFTSPSDWSPGDTTTKTLIARNNGTILAAVRVKYEEEWTDSNGDEISNVPNNAVILNYTTPSSWTYNSNDGYYYYNYSIDAGQQTTSLIDSVTLNSNLNNPSCVEENGVQTCTIDAQGLAGATYTLTFTIETCQYDKYQEVWGTDIELLNIEYGYKTYNPSNNNLTEMAFGENGYSALNSDVYLKFPVINDIVDENHVEVCFYDTVENKEYCLKNGMDDTENNIDIINKYCDFDENTWSHQTENGYYILWEDSYEKFHIYSYFGGGYYLNSDTINVELITVVDEKEVAVENISKNIRCYVLSSGRYNCYDGSR